MAIEAESVMAKVREVVKGVERDCDLDLGDFECKIVLSVLGKDKTPIKDIAQAFITEMTGESDIAAPTTGTSTGASSEVELGNTIESTSGTSSDVGKMTILHNGFLVGSTVEETGKSAAGKAHLEGHLFKISFIASDGTVTLVMLGKDGVEKKDQVVSKSMDLFLTNFKVFSKDIEVDNRIEYSQTSEFKVDVAKGMLLCAMSIASHKSTFDCEAQKKPVKALVASSDMNAGDTIMLVPTTSCFKVIAEGDLAAFVATVTSEGTLYRFQLCAPPSKYNSKAFVMRCSDDKANCKIESMSVVIPLKYRETGAATKITCDIPVVKLTKDVKALDELALPMVKVVKQKVVRSHAFQEAPAAKVRKIA